MEQKENKEFTPQYDQCLGEILLMSSESNVLKIEHIFKLIQQNLTNINKNMQMADILRILDRSIQMAVRKDTENDISSINLEHYILEMLDEDKTDGLQDVRLEHALQVLYQILQTLSPKDKMFLIGDDLFLKLKEIMLKESTKPQTIANILACFKLYVNKFEAATMLATLWHRIKCGVVEATKNDAILQILITLFDEFANCREIKDFGETLRSTLLIEPLLHSEEHDKRKCAYFLLKKSYHWMPGTPQFWTTCINTLENLEENQSHLILPSLELLKSVDPSNDHECYWLDILYQKILAHNNILVRRWVLEHFLKHKKFHELPPNVAFAFVRSLNETTLYNVEGYMLPTENINHFLDNGNQKFLEIISQLNWKAAPLHFWLSRIFNEISVDEQNSVQVLINLASKIRVLQNVTFRNIIVKEFKLPFDLFLQRQMNLPTYAAFVKALYNVADYIDPKTCIRKIIECPNDVLEAKGNFIFDQRLYELIANNFISEPQRITVDTVNKIYQKLDGVITLCQGYLSLLVIFHSENSLDKQDFCQRHYNLNLSQLYQIKIFDDLFNLLWVKLKSIVENKFVIRQRAMDFFICSTGNFKTFDDLSSCGLKLDEILSTGTFATLVRVSRLLVDYKEKVNDGILESLFKSLSEYLKNIDYIHLVVPNIFKYIQKVFKPKDCAAWTRKILELDLENVRLMELIMMQPYPIKYNDEQFLIRGALNGDAKTGDARIEETYLKSFVHVDVKGPCIRQNYIWQINKESTALKISILMRVCELAKELNIKKPRYFANSKEHRKLIRMTNLLWSLKDTKIDDVTMDQLFQKLWSLLMDYNNQPNVTIILECMVVRFASFEMLMSKIAEQKKNGCTSSQEVSIIMLLYRYFEAKCKADLSQYQEAIFLLWPLTMGSSFQTRLYSQLVAVKLTQRLMEKDNENQTPSSRTQACMELKNSIKQMIGEVKLEMLLKDVRFSSSLEPDFYIKVMCSTQTPTDEFYMISFEMYLPAKKLLEVAKSEASLEENQNVLSLRCNNTCIAIDVQRKMNPIADFMPQSNLKAYSSTCKENELFVIASFIDKIPNLGGIARTCEVLGINNLVMATKADTNKADFKNLSMTAEKSLNIIEIKPNQLQHFLMQKKSEGFSIIGAEQTAKSCNFADFKFPNRSILLLGHEKEGIPPNFLGFLDYAVEIPQFGMVRSLNVHVTGALFMWEYCKEHIYKKET